MAEAIRSPLIIAGGVRLVEPRNSPGLVLDKVLAIVAPTGERFSTGPVVVDSAASFTPVGIRTTDIIRRNVPGRGHLDDFEVGRLFLVGVDAGWYQGRSLVENCGQLAISRATL